jgi:predicted nucleic acid-binding protein
MPENEVVVSDTSPLLNLALIDRLDLLRSQFEEVTIPTQVWSELTNGEAGVDALARRHDLSMTGVIGVLLRRANTGEVAIQEELDALRGAGFWISDDLYSKAISEAEQPDRTS